MKENHSELIEYLDEKFGRVDKKLDKKVDKEDLKDLSSKLVTLDEFDGFKKEINERFDGLEKRFDNLIDSVDNLTKAIKDYHQEQVALSAKVDRHEKWITQIAEKMGIELKA